MSQFGNLDSSKVSFVLSFPSPKRWKVENGKRWKMRKRNRTIISFLLKDHPRENRQAIERGIGYFICYARRHSIGFLRYGSGPVAADSFRPLPHTHSDLTSRSGTHLSPGETKTRNNLLFSLLSSTLILMSSTRRDGH